MAWLVAPAEPFDKCFIGATAELDKVTTSFIGSGRFSHIALRVP